ncbi:MAG: FAD-binding oxidoreductase [Streptosporangiales bacterium]|nr:FAD-binding oxidoreductase [Streptosporangiales bacterium]
MTQTADRSTDSLRIRMMGTVLTGDDAGYDDARSVFNGAVDRRPAIIARCANSTDVAHALRFAREHGLEVSVRGGAHNFAGIAVAVDGMMIDLSPMRRVTVDPDARVAVVGGGATLADLDAATQEHGLAVTGGTVSHTGVGGLTLGGGFGWLTPMLGLTSDNLVAADLVTADSRQLRVTADEHPELFWAIRGGGGNFGVVTSFEFRLHPVGPLVDFGLLFWEDDRLAEALRLLRDIVATLPRTTGALIAPMNAPPAVFIPEAHHLTPGVAFLLAGFAGRAEHAKLLEPVRAALPPLFEFVTPMPYTALQQALDESAPWGINVYEKALWLDELSDGAIDVVRTHLPKRTSPMSFVPTFALYGAYGDLGDETAFGATRKERFAFNVAAITPDPRVLAAERAWARAFWQDMLPHAAGTGNYVNFLAEADDARVRSSFGPKYARLARVKAAYDPDNVFHLNPNIKPAT